MMQFFCCLFPDIPVVFVFYRPHRNQIYYFLGRHQNLELHMNSFVVHQQTQPENRIGSSMSK